MPDPSNNTPIVVTLRNPGNLPVPGDVRVSRESLDWPQLAQGVPGPRDTWRVTIKEHYFVDKPSRFAPFQGRLTLVAEDPSPRKLLAMLDDLRHYGGHYEFTPETVRDSTMAIMTASLNIPTHLAFSEDWTADTIDDLLDYFLRSLALQVPIEPFYFLASAVSEQHENTLWDYYHEVLGRSFFVDPALRVTLSARWAEREMFFGTIEQQENDFRASSLWTDLQGREQRIFVAQEPCVFCEHYRYCAGFWRTTRQADKTCGLWRGVMDRLVEACKQHTNPKEEPSGAEHSADHLL